MKHSCFSIKINTNKNHESFSCRRQSISLSHKICQFYGNPKSERVQRSGTPQRSEDIRALATIPQLCEDNWRGALLLEKEK